MNLLRKWFGDRRQEDTQGVRIEDDRRGTLMQRHKAATAKLEKAVEDLNETLSMKTDDFHAMLRREAREKPSEVTIFSTFAAICEFRYSPKDSIMTLCKHKSHEAHLTGIAPCRESKCPLWREAGAK